jgi:hypothetical protein
MNFMEFVVHMFVHIMWSQASQHTSLCPSKLVPFGKLHSGCLDLGFTSKLISHELAFCSIHLCSFCSEEFSEFADRIQCGVAVVTSSDSVVASKE